MTDEEGWDACVGRIPRETFEAWIREIHGNHVSDMHWLDGPETTVSYLSFMGGTYICGLDLACPPDWVRYRVLRDIERREKLEMLEALLAKAEYYGEGQEKALLLDPWHVRQMIKELTK